MRLDWQDRLIGWYAAGHRELPWRQTHDPYRVWISEIMLQQTRVEAVIGYYERFLAAYPTVQDLAEAPLDAVLKLWEGLGYYSRAKNLQRAAQQIVAQGGFPEEYAEILKLAGVGEYTAGAIWSIAYNKPAAAVDGNVLRVISRLYALEGDITEDRSRKAIRDIVQEHIPGAADYEHGPSAYTQSLMELGAMICIPGNPRCVQCPLREDCLAYQQGRAGELPVKKKKERQKVVLRYIGIAERTRNGQREVLMHRRPDSGLLAGLWEYPGVEADSLESMQEKFLTEYGMQIRPEGHLLDTEHIFTHRHWKMRVYLVRLTGPEPTGPQWRWAETDAQQELMIPTAFRRIQEYLAEPEQLRLV